MFGLGAGGDEMVLSSMASGSVSQQSCRERVWGRLYSGLASHAVGGRGLVRTRRDLHKFMNIL